MTLPLPDIPDTGKLTDGNDAINATRQALNSFWTTYSAYIVKVLSVALGGTGATSKHPARNNLGITSGTANPSGGADGDIYFKIV